MSYLRLSKSFKRYLLIGVTVFVFELGVIFTAQNLGASKVAAVAYSFWLGLIASFFLQKFITFGDTRTHRRILLRQAVAFSLLVAFNFLFTIGVTALTSDIMPAAASRSVALGLSTLWNYYLYKSSIFNPDKDKTGGSPK